MKTKLLMGAVMVLASVSHIHARDSGSTGGGQTHSNWQPSLGVNHIIAVQGLYPPYDLTGGDGSVTLLGGVQPFIGEVSMFGGNFAPRGWAFCDGQLLSISSNEALFSILGTTYGGDGRTTFALPDLRGRTAIHAGTGPGLTNRWLGEKSGAETVTVTQSEMPAHSHPPQWTSDVTLNAGGGQGHQNMQPYLVLNNIIALQGIYPSSSLTGGEGSAEMLNGADPFLAEMGWFAGNFAPRGSAFSNGQLLSISSNDALFSLLGTIYGGDGRTTFGLPDLRGRAAIGPRTGPGLTTRHLGQKLGQEEVSLTANQLPPHAHSLPPSVFPTGSTGVGQPHTEMQPSLGLNYIIAMQGTFPSRNLTEEGDAVSALGAADPFLGEIRLFGSNFAPRGWAFCDGQLLSISSYSALFALLGTTYGGDGRTTFSLPDLRGRIPVHPGTGPGLTRVSLGQNFGDEYLALGEMPAHTHVVPDLNIPGDADSDGVLDFRDYLTIKLHLGAEGEAGWPEGNFGFDSSVDRTDLMALVDNFDATGGAAYRNPEPATLALLAVGALAALKRRRRD